MQDFRLTRSERLRGKKAFDFLFQHANSLRVGVLKVFFVWDMPQDCVQEKVSMAVAVPKRLFKKSHDRQLLKRRLREAFRLNKHLLKDALKDTPQNLVLFIKYDRKEAQDFSTIEKNLITAFGKILATLPADDSLSPPNT